MVVVAGIREAGVFGTLAQRLCQGTHSSRQLGTILILLCFFSSMFVTNDVALITFVPFAILILTVTAQTKHLPYIITLQTVAANLGSMATPVGNPQNLYLYSYYQIPLGDLFSQVLPWTLLSLIILLILCRFISLRNYSSPVSSSSIPCFQKASGNIGRLISSLPVKCFAHSALVGCVIHSRSGLAFCKTFPVDQSGFWIACNLCVLFYFCWKSQTDPLHSEFLAGLLSGKELIVSALTSQVISNVPAAVLLSGFTQNGMRSCWVLISEVLVPQSQA